MSPKLKETLDFINDPSIPVTIRHNDFNWEFHYSISPLADTKGRELSLKRRKTIETLTQKRNNITK